MSCLSWRGIFHGNWENKSKFQIGGLREAGGLLLFSPVRAHLLTTQKGRWYCLRQPCALRGGCGSCGSLMSNATSHLCCCHWPRSRLYVLLHHQNCCFRFGNNPPPARIKLPPAALFAVMGMLQVFLMGNSCVYAIDMVKLRCGWFNPSDIYKIGGSVMFRFMQKQSGLSHFGFWPSPHLWTGQLKIYHVGA